eukprot:6748447-Prorocentrum_lima.AAC.1
MDHRTPVMRLQSLLLLLVTVPSEQSEVFPLQCQCNPDQADHHLQVEVQPSMDMSFWLVHLP